MVISNSLEDLETERGLEEAAEPVSHHLHTILYIPVLKDSRVWFLQNLSAVGGGIMSTDAG